jgi:RNA-directed DNA polymerase
MRRGKSDPLIVLRARESRVHGEAREQDNRFSGDTSPTRRGRIKMSTALLKIAAKAKQDPNTRFTSFAHILTPEFLRETWRQLNRKGASGIDGETIAEFETNLEERINDLWRRLRAGQYQAPPVRRVEIPKGNGKTRPLGIPTVEDRLLQRAVARILSAIYEPEFLECSFGYRPGRTPHMALKALRDHIVTGKVRYVYEADIQGYFTNINHKWLRQMIALRIADPVITGLIGKWLKAGVMEHGVVARPEAGTPQGGPISPGLANAYLHYVLDLWFEKRAKREMQGEAYLTRFVDDFVVAFQYKRDAERFDHALKIRMQKFGLRLAPEKTRLNLFGRFAQEQAASYGGRSGTFAFLGFKHVCGVDTKGKFAVIRIPAEKSCRKFLTSTAEWLKRHRHWRRRDQQRYLSIQLKGFYQYFALNRCVPKLERVKHHVEKQWRHAIKRQSQRHYVYWSYLRSRSWFVLPHPKVLHPGF